MDEMPENFLKKIREDRNIGQTELADLTGIKKQNIYAWENGKSEIPRKNLKKIADALGISVNYLITGAEDSFDGKSKERLSKAMLLADEHYGSSLKKHEMVEVATEVYDLLTTFDSIVSEDGKKKFLQSLKSKYISGLAANCIINSEPNNE